MTMSDYISVERSFQQTHKNAFAKKGDIMTMFYESDVKLPATRGMA